MVIEPILGFAGVTPGKFCWWPASSRNHHYNIYCLDEPPEHMLAHNTDVVYPIAASEIQHFPIVLHHLSSSLSVCDVLMLTGAPFEIDPRPAGYCSGTDAAYTYAVLY